MLEAYGNKACFEYNSAGIRVEKCVNGVPTKYVVAGNTIVSEETSGTKTIYYHSSEGVVGFNRGGVDYFCRKNLQGDIIAILDANGNVLAKYVYDAWGNHKVYTSADTLIYDSQNPSSANSSHIGCINPFRYRSYYFDSETGLYYLNSRYYDPQVGRFINADSIDYLEPENIQGLNLYSYCYNNPISYIDPTGHFVTSLLLALTIGAVLGGVYGGVSAVANGQNVFVGIAIGAVVGGLTGLFTEVLSVPYMLLATFAVGAGGDMASQMILDGKSFWDVNLISAAWAGIANAGLAFVGKGLSTIDKMARLTTTESIIFGTATNSPLLALGMAINMGVSRHAAVYTIDDLLNEALVNVRS